MEGPLGAVSDFASWHLLSGCLFSSDPAERVQGRMVFLVLHTHRAGWRRIWGNGCTSIPSLIFAAAKIQTLDVIC